MNCKQAQRDIALWVGQDLDDARERDDVHRHVSSCPACRDHYRRMKGALKALGRADTPETYVTTGSLWPELAARINNRQSPAPRGQFNGWMPFVAMTAACFILMLVVNEQRSPHGPLGPPTARGPVFPNPVIRVDSPFLQNNVPSPNVPSPSVRFEDRDAADDINRLDESRREAVGDRF